VADGKRMYSNYRMDVIDKVLGPNSAKPVAVQVRVGMCGGRGEGGGCARGQRRPEALFALCCVVYACTHILNAVCLHSSRTSALSPKHPQVPVQGRQPGSDQPITIPDSLVAVQAFIMWEEAGKPQVGG
jgi:hypothetical protein